jgi:hypothetical protein
LFIVAGIHRKRAGGVMMMVAEGEGLPKDDEGKKLFHGDGAIVVAVEAIKLMIEQDRAAGK